jgi:hypothetical protein
MGMLVAIFAPIGVLSGHYIRVHMCTSVAKSLSFAKATADLTRWKSHLIDRAIAKRTAAASISRGVGGVYHG